MSFSACVFKKVVIFMLTSVFLVRAEKDGGLRDSTYLEDSSPWPPVGSNDRCIDRDNLSSCTSLFDQVSVLPTQPTRKMKTETIGYSQRIEILGGKGSADDE